MSSEAIFVLKKHQKYRKVFKTIKIDRFASRFVRY